MPASTASHLRHCHHPLSSLSPQQPHPAPAPALRLCAGPVAGTSSSGRPAFLFSCNSSHGLAAATQEMLWPPKPQYWPPPPGAKAWISLSAVFSFRSGQRKRKETPTPPQKNNRKHRIGDYLFVFNLFCHIFVKRQKCNKKYISTVPEDRAVETGLRGPSDLRLAPGGPGAGAHSILWPWCLLLRTGS